MRGPRVLVAGCIYAVCVLELIVAKNIRCRSYAVCMLCWLLMAFRLQVVGAGECMYHDMVDSGYSMTDCHFCPFECCTCPQNLLIATSNERCDAWLGAICTDIRCDKQCDVCAREGETLFNNIHEQGFMIDGSDYNPST